MSPLCGNGNYYSNFFYILNAHLNFLSFKLLVDISMTFNDNLSQFLEKKKKIKGIILSSNTDENWIYLSTHLLSHMNRTKENLFSKKWNKEEIENCQTNICLYKLSRKHVNLGTWMDLSWAWITMIIERGFHWKINLFVALKGVFLSHFIMNVFKFTSVFIHQSSEIYI